MARAKVSKSNEITAYSEMAFRNNNAMIEYCRTSACALSGCTAGIMGLTGLQGFGFYFCAVLGLWCLLLLKAGPSWEKYFVNRIHLLTNGFFGGLFTYVLFWTYPFFTQIVGFFLYVYYFSAFPTFCFNSFLYRNVEFVGGLQTVFSFWFLPNLIDSTPSVEIKSV